ncbi:hybrid sensor histidine kinase/response regulator transcription factor [Prevotella intermedia]|uniref:hybrid sensor histidine kinase/response regulator transcription factor n=1 Tax=Prevotella intermedia TaxID=28131 RepID=UPI000BE6FB2F|nr:response regulator [Prevotella intermedia]PDP82961.1 hybrid sensor histidine kinase/response regulator [Prevotella intermedia]
MQYYKHNIKTTLETYYKPFKSRNKRRYLILSALTVFVSTFLLLVSCGKKPISFTPAERKTTDSIVRSTHGVDSLALLQKQMESEGNKLGSIVALREWGKALRNESRFEEALSVHSKGQQQTESVGDTLELVQALNNIGTDYRRMGVLDVAQEYHYNAWKLSEECTDTSFTAKKNRVVSLNGLGNVYLALGNYERADSALRMALAGERSLNSTVGQAINYANLGSIFEHKGKTDSAWVYYRKSMALNTEAEKELGISLCHTYFGSLYEKAGEYGKATTEYETAYQMMQASKDDWHALNSLIALARIYHTTGNNAKAMAYLGKAKQIAERIKSKEHLAEIYTLYYKNYKQKGDCSAALASYEKATAIQDSVLDMEKVNRIQNASLKIERHRQERQMNEARHRLEEERTTRYIGYIILGIVLFSLAGILAMVLYTNRLRQRNHRALKRMSALRENFFTNITHEFRTPLTVILGLSHELQSSDTEEVKMKAQTIERQGNGLLMLINQLLDISKIKSAVGNPDWKNGNIIAYLTMVVESYHNYARSRNIDLQFFPKGEVFMDFVPNYVVKVMNNLLSNAFKFTPEYGKVNVSAWCENQQLFVDVSDTGKGMSKEVVSHIFEPFYQDENDIQNIGTGVGLALVKQIMNAVDGEITVESIVGKGTTFHVSMPIRNRYKQQIAPNAEVNAPLLPEITEIPEDSNDNDNDCRLLIIEDNHDIATYIGSLFTDQYAIFYAENGKEGLGKALDLIPDLIITDLMMPGMDGLEVCRQVRGNEIINHIPIIVVTAKITEEERIKGIEAGADAYLSKPFNTEELRTRVEKLLAGRKLLQEKFAKMSVELKKEEEEGIEPPKEADLRFLTKVTSVVYMQLSKNKDADVAVIASYMCMSPRQFHRKINALTGYSPSIYIQRLKIRKACNILDKDPKISFMEVADLCGFDAYPNFVRAFKNVCGVTPTDYRRKSHI